MGEADNYPLKKVCSEYLDTDILQNEYKKGTLKNKRAFLFCMFFLSKPMKTKVATNTQTIFEIKKPKC